ncbi:SDR family oxidoreductase [Nitrospinae bacterium AH_259_B05_G02_I21]|nr:SDR family oxidoreductase [Nitrospinae bacterium AH_259_B05_G02_I21]
MTTTKNTNTVLITGASSGIGLGVAEAYLERGANVVLNARNEAKLKEVTEKFGRPDQIALVPGDISLRSTSQHMVDAAVERFGRVDLLVNNAGHFFPKPFTDYTEEDLDGFLATHLKGTYFASQAAANQMRKQGGGAIVNITTVLALRGVTAIPASAPIAAKGGMNAITRSLAIELAPDNIRVNTVAPGIIKTPIYGRTDEQFEELNGMQPLGRVGQV